MPVMVALLRAVNVGGKNRLAMADLRSIAEACGLEQARTYIQSGNLVFATAMRRTDAVAKKLTNTIAEAASVEPDVIVRTRSELASVVDRNPYRKRDEDPTHLHVVFMSGSAKASIESADLAAYAPEEAAAVGRQLYLFLPSGVGRSKLAADLGRQQGPGGTMRNWRTVTTLLEMANELARRR